MLEACARSVGALSAKIEQKLALKPVSNSAVACREVAAGAHGAGACAISTAEAAAASGLRVLVPSMNDDTNAETRYVAKALPCCCRYRAALLLRARYDCASTDALPLLLHCYSCYYSYSYSLAHLSSPRYLVVGKGWRRVGAEPSPPAPPFAGSLLPPGDPQGTFKSGVLFALPNESQALYRALSSWALRGLNMTKIDSRPSSAVRLLGDFSGKDDAPNRHWDLVFYVEWEMSKTASVNEAAMRSLAEFSLAKRELGVWASDTRRAVSFLASATFEEVQGVMCY